MKFGFAALLILASVDASAADLRAVVQPLPRDAGEFAHDISWANGDVLVATERGVFRYKDADARSSPARVVAAVAIPDGITDPRSVDSDGITALATTLIPPSGFAWRSQNSARLWAEQSADLIASDGVVVKGQLCVLARRPHPADDAIRGTAVWCGPPDWRWREYRPVHRIRSGHAAVSAFRSAPFHLDGALARDDDGNILVITSAEPGVFRYTPDGKLLEVRGGDVSDFLLTNVEELRTRYAMDPAGGYRNILNRQPIIDDLVSTPGGPAVVVRLPQKQGIVWELWFPAVSGGIGERLRLSFGHHGPYGHLRCSAHGARLACVASLPPPSVANALPEAQRYPHLLLFALPRPASAVR